MHGPPYTDVYMHARTRMHFPNLHTNLHMHACAHTCFLLNTHLWLQEEVRALQEQLEGGRVCLADVLRQVGLRA